MEAKQSELNQQTIVSKHINIHFKIGKKEKIRDIKSINMQKEHLNGFYRTVQSVFPEAGKLCGGSLTDA